MMFIEWREKRNQICIIPNGGKCERCLKVLLKAKITLREQNHNIPLDFISKCALFSRKEMNVIFLLVCLCYLAHLSGKTMHFVQTPLHSQ